MTDTPPPTGPDESGPSSDPPECQWIEADDNPWGVRVLDVRPVTLGMLSVSENQECAANLVAMGREDGRRFADAEPEEPDHVVEADLRYRLDGDRLAPGSLFNPQSMEHKWGIFFHADRILFVRSWTCAVRAVAEVETREGELRVTRIRGSLQVDGEPADHTQRVADYLIRSHCLGRVHPVPLLGDADDTPEGRQALGFDCMGAYGKLAWYATAEPVDAPVPDQPLRTDSLLHIAVAKGESDRVRELLNGGWSLHLYARDGLQPLHWSMARWPDRSMPDMLLEAGASIDDRTDEGATVLMQCVQAGSPDEVQYALEQGADVNARDMRGFTGLHRAAEMGQQELTRVLLDRGADPSIAGGENGTHTALSLAEQREHTAIIEMLRAAT